MKLSTMKAAKESAEVKMEAAVEARPAFLQVALETIVYKTRERLELINITKDVNEIVKKHGFRAGFVLVQSLHTTTAIFINEFQQALVDDMKAFLERVVGRFDYWRHNDPRLSECYRKNADAHLRAMLLGHTLSLPVSEGALAIGNWQSVILAELDGPRDRAVQIQVLGVPQEATK
ncbi:MAG TPA: secondary thiamine-phosphate synthase enzyme YjbQ [Candidatus Acidoferrales bacterium]|nr:secondary thiamine-phosphate synthase enzyme YjbQ [Candidatus Acidoferrales bacterium]